MQNLAAGAAPDLHVFAVHAANIALYNEQVMWLYLSMRGWTETLTEWDPSAGPHVVIHDTGPRHRHLEGAYATWIGMIEFDGDTRNKVKT